MRFAQLHLADGYYFNTMDTGIDATGKKIVYYRGMKFVRDDKRGYYRANKYTGNLRTVYLHRLVWESANGAIPNGFHVHHKDRNKANNVLNNLVIIHGNEHVRMHGKMISEDERHKKRSWMINNVIPKAAEWHSSQKSHDLHVKLFTSVTKGIWFAPRKVVCKMCGIEYVAHHSNGRFCSNKCKSAYRRKIGADNIVSTCIICGSSFVTSKLRPGKTCSRKCRWKFRKSCTCHSINATM